MVSTEVTTWLSVCCSDCARLSMSLVTRDRISPRGCASKYRSGSRASLACTSARIRNTSRCTIVVVTRPWNSAATDAAAYRASTMTSRRPSALKSTPCPGCSGSDWISPAWAPLPSCCSPAITSALVVPAGIFWEITPVKMMFVASPSSRGPVTVSATLTTASSSAPAASTRSGAISRSSRLLDPRKSRDFSVLRPLRKAAGPRPIVARSGPRPRLGVARSTAPGPLAPLLLAPPLAAGPGCWLVTPPPARSAGTARSPGRSRRRPSARDGCRWRRPGRCPEPRSGPRAGSWPPAGPR